MLDRDLAKYFKKGKSRAEAESPSIWRTFLKFKVTYLRSINRNQTSTDLITAWLPEPYQLELTDKLLPTTSQISKCL